MRVLITGAAGRLGGEAHDALDGPHELFLLDRRRSSERRVLVADLTAAAWRPRWLGGWRHLLRGTDVVFHLAGDGKTNMDWPAARRGNIEATWQLFTAAAAAGVRRIVFASTYRVVRALELRLEPGCYGAEGPKIDSTEPAHASTPYTISKAFGEALGRGLVTDRRLESFLAIRIGACSRLPPRDDRRPNWLGYHDWRALARCAVEAPFSGFHVVYGVSAQEDAPYDLGHTRTLLGWEPQQRPGETG